MTDANLGQPPSVTGSGGSYSGNVRVFDFLRAAAALGVFLCHADILGGGQGLFRRLGGPCVDVFMFTSGFLMFFTALHSKEYGQLSTVNGVGRFWCRRFFRISPLYYIALAAALSLSPLLGECRTLIASVLPDSGTAASRYYMSDVVTTVVWHVTYAFGLVPKYSFSTPLPDWSLGLEVQFYLAFPLFFVVLKCGRLLLFGLICIAMIGMGALLPGLGLDYPMPSFLPLKFHAFAAGMLLGFARYLASAWRRTMACVLCVFIAGIGSRSLAFVGFVVSVGVMLLASEWLLRGIGGRLVCIADRAGLLRIISFLAEISYSLYLMHLLVLLPYMAVVAVSPSVWLPSSSRFNWAVHTIVSLALSLGLAYVTYTLIERPGIKIGRRLVRQVR